MRPRVAAAAARDDPVVDPNVIARVTVGLLGAAAVLAGLGAATATTAGTVPACLALAIAALTVAWGLLAVPAIRHARTYGLATAMATACATVAVLSGSAGAAAAPIFYVPVAIYAACFL